MKQTKKITIDVIYNLIASAIPTLLLQFIIHPIIARIAGNDSYGEMLTVLSVVNICVGMFGSPFNNARLLENDSYKSPGDFNVLMAMALLLSLVLQGILSIAYHFAFSLLGFILIAGYNVTTILGAYYSVEFRIKLSYKKICVGKLMQATGYGLGAAVFYFTQRWEFVFFFGGLLELVYILANTTIWKEPYVFTERLTGTAKRIVILVLTTALSLVITYADRLIIYPAFGSEDVAVYYAATVIGKAILLITNPVGGVILSYVAKLKNMQRKHFIMLLSAVSVLGLVGYVGSCILSDPLIRIMYPESYPQALQYTPITNATVMIGLLYSFAWPVVFRFGNKTAPLLLAIIRIGSYLLITFLGMKTLGVMSVCYGNLISTSLQSLTVIVMGLCLCKNTVAAQQEQND